MNSLIPTIIALLAYIASIALILPSILNPKSYYRLSVWITTAIALIAHASHLYERVFPLSLNGVELSLLNLGSVVSVFICAAIISTAWQNKGWQLLPIAYSFALINLILTAFFPENIAKQLESNPILLIHIGMALLAYSTLFIASLNATFLAWINYRLKHRNLPLGHRIPPLMQIERHFVSTTQIGFSFLSVTLLVGFIYLPEPFGILSLHKTLLSCGAWFVYGSLISGHYLFGWRGVRIVRLSYLGIILLSFAYIGNRLIIGY
ncbi:cytochrome C assembly family protein [Thorsellia anophelis]|uniref:ABC-type uncharacterized transport system, permease component n=1 Tax=Thorsellia anophelis DSM 18579 TaxID=1123402 RepID=A0A1H9YN12_9GAMM|nr:cytochrome c biogenesis protein CcsA [Thorsellia anophelis]SES70005.1 ABC-type uncharacterized transport system, permease component [Thorsellia anophelis DSM 18579]